MMQKSSKSRLSRVEGKSCSHSQILFVPSLVALISLMKQGLQIVLSKIVVERQRLVNFSKMRSWYFIDVFFIESKVLNSIQPMMISCRTAMRFVNAKLRSSIFGWASALAEAVWIHL
eukprot:TRINITY_DN22192_c0_g1_i1.p2 TRINITY_DN22192_c0_g1~~TRINITY_DN22192_c0_g1_i1.p2  ORF type:complete len:117 (-),score=1.79 TRINITY_DN22192_c0_g1_i1:44-394(-)